MLKSIPFIFNMATSQDVNPSVLKRAAKNAIDKNLIKLNAAVSIDESTFQNIVHGCATNTLITIDFGKDLTKNISPITQRAAHFLYNLSITIGYNYDYLDTFLVLLCKFGGICGTEAAKRVAKDYRYKLPKYESYSIVDSSNACDTVVHDAVHNESTEESQMESMIKRHIQEQGKMNIKVVKGMLYGPPRVGKTSLKKRLIGEKLTGISPSTGIDSPCTIPIYHDTEVTAALISNISWKPLDDVKESLQTCLHFLANLPLNPTTPPDYETNSDSDINTSSMPVTNRDTAVNHQSLSQPNSHNTIAEPNKNTYPQPSDDSLRRMIDLINEGNWTKINKELEGTKDVTLFQMIDVGGQPEFHDILPLLLTGPALYLLFIRLDQELDETYTYHYQYTDGSNSAKYTSQLTVFQVLHQILSTIGSSSDDDGTSAIIIGTHRDNVTEDKYKKVDSQLKMKMRGNVYYECIKHRGDDMVFPVDNKSDTMKDEIIPLRERIKRVLSTKFKGESLPTTYALFYYLLQYQPRKILTLDEARDLAKGLKIDSIIEDVLKFIHNKFGSVLFYDDVYNENGEKLLFCDPNVILHAVNELVAVCFGANPDDKPIADDLRKTGTVTPANFETLCQFSENYSRLKYFVINLLKKRHILSTITVDSNEKYFLPCLLDVCGSEDIPYDPECEVTPLLIRICPKKDTRYTTIPPGLFPSIIVMLSNSSQSSENKKWTLVNQKNEQCFKNKVSFFFSGQVRVKVDLIAQVQWIEIRLKKMSPVTAPMIRKHIVAAIEAIRENQTLLGQILTNCKLEFGFYCHQSLPTLQYAAANCDESQLECTGCTEDNLHDMEENQLIWFKDPPLSTNQTEAQPVTQQLTKGERGPMQPSITTQKEEKLQTLIQRRTNQVHSQDTPVDSDINQLEDEPPSASSTEVSGSTPSLKTTSTSGTCYKSIFISVFVIGVCVFVLACVYLVYTNYYMESMSNTDSKLAIGTAIIGLIVLIFLLLYCYYKYESTRPLIVIIFPIVVALTIALVEYLITSNPEKLKAAYNSILGRLMNIK